VDLFALYIFDICVLHYVAQHSVAMPVELDEIAATDPGTPVGLPPVTGGSPQALALTETLAGAAPASSRPVGQSLGAGRQLAHFRIDRLLGAGGMGEVYHATDLALDRPVALKVLAHGSATAARRDRLIREARAQARIYHPNVCHIYYIGESDGLLFFAMELVTGQTFSERLSSGPVSPDEALELIRSAALGLREATRCGFTHRDVKPSNLMIDQHGNVKVMDFGLVAGSGGPAEERDGGGSTVEQTSMAGTPLYMAPEQARGEPIDFRADIYALGATLYHLVAGQPPFSGDSVAELLKQHSSAELPAFIRRDVSSRALSPVKELCARMMAKDPAQRHASYDDLLRELELLSSERSRPAGATVRTAAATIDLFVLVPVLMGISWLIETVWGRSMDGMIAFALVFSTYRFVTVTWLGRSLGQAIFELEVINMVDGRRPSRGQLLRRLAWQFGLPMLTQIGAVIFHDSRTLLGHLIKGSQLVAFGLLLVSLYYASVRLAQRRTWWDRKSATMVRYRPR
jgi:hypothetical protein